MEDKSLYLEVKNKICELIYKGIYTDGENIPPERLLAERLHVSRVTVRKALEALEKEGIIERVQGSGTRVKLSQVGHKGTMDIIALLAPAQKPFFAAFIDHFQKNADKNDSLVLFMQNPQDSKIEDSLFKLFQKNIRNVVVWLEDLMLDTEYIKRLRGLGMNIVFFDISVPTPYADCVVLDNQDAIKSLFEFLSNKGAKKLSYVGWDNLLISSVRERENTFTELTGDKEIFHIPWAKRNDISKWANEIASEVKEKKIDTEGIICGDGELGVALKRAFNEHGLIEVPMASIDDFPEAKNLSLSVLRQSFTELADKVYECLSKQNRHAKKWKAGIYTVKGELIGR